MSKIGLSISMIGGILFFILMYFFARWYYYLLKFDMESVLFFYFFLLTNGGAIVGALLGFIDKSWQIGQNRQIKSVRAGRIMCFFVGFSLPLFLLIQLGGAKSLTFAEFFEFLIEIFYISLPELLLFIGGIISIIELELELRKNNLKHIREKENRSGSVLVISGLIMLSIPIIWYISLILNVRFYIFGNEFLMLGFGALGLLVTFFGIYSLLSNPRMKGLLILITGSPLTGVGLYFTIYLFSNPIILKSKSGAIYWTIFLAIIGILVILYGIMRIIIYEYNERLEKKRFFENAKKQIA